MVLVDGVLVLLVGVLYLFEGILNLLVGFGLVNIVNLSLLYVFCWF